MDLHEPEPIGGPFKADPDCPTPVACEAAEWCGQGCHAAAEARIAARKAQKPVPPLPRWKVKGIPVPFGPAFWMWGEHHLTPSGVAVSLDGIRTHPKKLTTAQQQEVDELLVVIGKYSR